MSPRLGVFLLASLSPTIAAGAPDAAQPPRYDLRPGDHLVYHQSLERTVTTPESQILTRAEWTSHVLVVAERAGNLQVGFQRNRTAAALLGYREGGKDRLERERPAFDERMARRPPAFAEANWVSSSGWPLFPWSAVRETPSEALPAFHELPPLPSGPLEAATRWTGPDTLGLTLSVTGRETLGGEPCVRAEGRSSRPALQLRYWFCPESGTLARLTFDGTYPAPPNRQVHETLAIDLAERRRGEDVQSWLAQPTLRQGVLAAFLTSTALAVPAEALSPLLDADDTGVQRQVLALLHRLRLPPPPLERLAALLGSPSPRVRTLAVRNLERVPAESARPLLARARDDSDAFVRRAAAALEGRVPEDPGLAALARSVHSSGPLPTWSCTDAGDWAEKALRARRMPAEVPGTTARRTTSGRHAGSPYIVSVPEDYRGDEPFPLLLYLSGGPGLAITGALGAEEALAPTGYLVVYPQAEGSWWDEPGRTAFADLLQEVLATFNVDANRVFLVGFSNGGTGTLLYATLWPHRFAAAAPLMGAGFPFFEDAPLPAVNVARLPLLFLHGDADPVIPDRASRQTFEAVRRVAPDAPATLEILKGRGHDVRLGGDSPRVLAFLEGRVRNPFPRHVAFGTRSLAAARSYWLEIAEKGAGLAEARGEIEDDGTIRVTTRHVKQLRLLLRRELLPGTLSSGSLRPIRVLLNGKPAFSGPVPEDCALLLSSWRETGDPFLAHSATIDLDVN